MRHTDTQIDQRTGPDRLARPAARLRLAGLPRIHDLLPGGLAASRIGAVGRSASVALLVLIAAIGAPARADQRSATGNAGTLTATAQLRFAIAVGQFVMLRVGNADATQASVTFTVAPTPAGPGNALAYAGPRPPTLASTVATTNPATPAGALVVSAFTNVAGTTLSCTLSPLAGATAFAIGATVGGVPGRSDIKVASASPGVQHPGVDLSSCTGTVTSPLTSLGVQTGSFTYSAAYVGSSLAAGTFGNVVTYTAATP